MISPRKNKLMAVFSDFSKIQEKTEMIDTSFCALVGLLLTEKLCTIILTFPSIQIRFGDIQSDTKNW